MGFQKQRHLWDENPLNILNIIDFSAINGRVRSALAIAQFSSSDSIDPVLEKFIRPAPRKCFHQYCRP
ncbi:MAG: hypothetical protein DSY89_01280 [Deltaproteobacteria bacterium]|nr:MAG: hypothetical protein DSY89_01280 [Deltaproteobacteria bacterium]